MMQETPRRTSPIRSCTALALVLLVGTIATGVAAARYADDGPWPQWGGPNRNFTVAATGLASAWPSAGPKRLWDRALGEGHSAIVSDGARLYTMYRPAGLLTLIRRSQEEVVIAVDSRTGATVWEHRFPSATGGLNLSEGAGPHSTPLLAGDRVFAVSTRAELLALDKHTGKVTWSHDLGKEFGAPLEDRGYAPSPIAYRQWVIVPVGGNGASVVAFDQRSGAVAWKAGSFRPGPASPILISVDGQDQLVVRGGDALVGMSPLDGSVLWSHPDKTEWGLNISTPVWGPGNTLLVSSAYNNGTRLLKLTRAGSGTTVQQLWFQNRMRVHIGSMIRLGDFAIGSSGDFGGVTVAGIDMNTGNVLWQGREFTRATFLHADGKLIVLDEDGNLGLATASSSGLHVTAKASVLTNRSWTAPTLVGTSLYLRDRARMIALDLR